MFIVVIGLPILLLDFSAYVTVLRLMRSVFLFALFFPWLGIALQFLTDNRLDTTIFTAFTILFTARLVIVDLEPNINSVGDALW